MQRGYEEQIIQRVAEATSQSELKRCPLFQGTFAPLCMYVGEMKMSRFWSELRTSMV